MDSPRPATAQSGARRITGWMTARYGQLRLARASNTIDALLISYPKSGRTWFRFILATYFAHVIGLEADIDLHSMFGILPNLDWDRKRGIPAYQAGPTRGLVPLIAVSHRYRSLVTPVPVIMMVRDPRDVIVSAYFHATRHKHRYTGTIDDFVRDDAQGLPSLMQYLNECALLLEKHPRCVVTYERLSAAPEVETARVLRFLGQEPDADCVRRAVAAANIEAMRALEVESGIPGHDYDRTDPEALRMRRGAAGGYRDYLSKDTLDWIDETCRQRLDTATLRLLAA